jgi:hypothetical protein
MRRASVSLCFCSAEVVETCKKRRTTIPVLDLSIDALLTTTYAVRKRLDLARSVELEVIRECLELALQVPMASYSWEAA